MLNLADIIGKFRGKRTAFVLKRTQEDILGQKCPYEEKRTKKGHCTTPDHNKKRGAVRTLL